MDDDDLEIIFDFAEQMPKFEAEIYIEIEEIHFQHSHATTSEIECHNPYEHQFSDFEPMPTYEQHEGDDGNIDDSDIADSIQIRTSQSQSHTMTLIMIQMSILNLIRQKPAINLSM